MSNIVPFNFDDHPIHVFTDDQGSPWFPANEVCEVLGFANPRDAVARHVDQEDVGKHDTLTAGGKQRQSHVNESGLYALIFGSTKPESKRFKKWVTSEVLPSIRTTGTYVGPKVPRAKGITKTHIEACVTLLRCAKEDLKLAPSAVLGGYQRLETSLGMHGMIPQYAIDSTGPDGSSSDETKSAAELLKIHGVGVSAAAFNQMLVAQGYLEERVRPSSKGGVKKFKVCTNLEFGKNLTSPSNPRETQPHWYVKKFAELLDQLLPQKVLAVDA